MRPGSAGLLVTRHPGPCTDGSPAPEVGAPPSAPPRPEPQIPAGDWGGRVGQGRLRAPLRQARNGAPRRGEAEGRLGSRSVRVGSPSAVGGGPARPRPSRLVPAPLRAPPPPSPQPPPPVPAPQHKLSVPLAPSSAPGASRSSPAHSAHSGQPPPQDPPSPAPLFAPSGPAEPPGRSAPARSDQVSRADAGRRPCWERWFGWLVLGWGGTRGGLVPRAIVQPEPEPRIWVPGSLEERGGSPPGSPAHPSHPTPIPPPRDPDELFGGGRGAGSLAPEPSPGPTSAFGVSRSGSGGPHGLGGLPPGSSQSRAPPPFGLPAGALSESAGPQLHAGLGPGLPAPRPAPARGARSRAGSWRVSGSKAARPGRVPPEGQELKFPPVCRLRRGGVFGVPALSSVSLALKGAGFGAFSSPRFLRALV